MASASLYRRGVEGENLKKIYKKGKERKHIRWGSGSKEKEDEEEKRRRKEKKEKKEEERAQDEENSLTPPKKKKKSTSSLPLFQHFSSFLIFHRINRS